MIDDEKRRAVLGDEMFDFGLLKHVRYISPSSQHDHVAFSSTPPSTITCRNAAPVPSVIVTNPRRHDFTSIGENFVHRLALSRTTWEFGHLSPVTAFFSLVNDHFERALCQPSLSGLSV